LLIYQLRIKLHSREHLHRLLNSCVSLNVRIVNDLVEAAFIFRSILPILNFYLIHRLVVRGIILHWWLLYKWLFLNRSWRTTLIHLTVDVIIIILFDVLLRLLHILFCYWRGLRLCLSKAHGLRIVIANIIWLSSRILNFFKIIQIIMAQLF